MSWEQHLRLEGQARNRAHTTEDSKERKQLEQARCWERTREQQLSGFCGESREQSRSILLCFGMPRVAEGSLLRPMASSGGGETLSGQ